MRCSDINIRDPFVLYENGIYYMYGTRAAHFGKNVGGFDVYTSKDLENWEVVTTLLVDRTMMNEYVSMMMHAFQYVHFAFDGDDLIYLVREAMDDSDNYHDNNYLTFYRLENFRSYLPK